jgi:ring-1,2-phenylacetyl-CoA epoxidase subunit PaaC
MSVPFISSLLYLADTHLILSHRNSEWCGHGPVLEQDIALTNISLDLLGQARNFYQYAAQLINEQGSPWPGIDASHYPVSEDTLAYLRSERDFCNLLMAEQPNGHWGQTILRQYLISQYLLLLFEALLQHSSTPLAGIVAKAIKETTYHVRWSSEWVVRLGDGTAESHQKMMDAVNELWCYTDEIITPASYETAFGVNEKHLQQQWLHQVALIFDKATLTIPQNCFMHTGGKTGVHTEQLGFILTDLQYLQRSFPGCEW